MGRIVRAVAKIAAVAVNFIPGIGQIASLAISAALTVGSSLLPPKARAPRNSPENLNRLRANVDPLTARKTSVGYDAMGVDVR